MSRDFVDKIHGNLNLPKWLFKIIDTPIFQRLGYIKQLATTNTVFINANHTRKEHSLGVAFLAMKYGQSLYPDDEKTQMKFMIAALLHDIGHGPFSHSWDKIIYYPIYGVEKGHDEHRKFLIKEVFGCILEELNIKSEDIIDIWTKKNYILSTLLQGPLGVDRLDFIARDTEMTVTSHFGTLDISRIINNTFIIKDKICYSAKILPDIIQGYMSRLNMYQNVYFHKTGVASIILIELMLKLALSAGNFCQKTLDINSFKFLHDSFVLYQVLVLSPDNDDIKLAQLLCNCYLERKFPKLVSEKCVSDQQPLTQIISRSPSSLQIEWISTPLNMNICSEFDKYNIHIFDTKSQTIIPFSTYLAQTPLYWSTPPTITYQIHRIYNLSLP